MCQTAENPFLGNESRCPLALPTGRWHEASVRQRPSQGLAPLGAGSVSVGAGVALGPAARLCSVVSAALCWDRFPHFSRMAFPHPVEPFLKMILGLKAMIFDTDNLGRIKLSCGFHFSPIWRAGCWTGAAPDLASRGTGMEGWQGGQGLVLASTFRGWALWGSCPIGDKRALTQHLGQQTRE